MPRNSSGVYTLPQPPVVTGTPISSTVENSTDSDIASELTNSLDRSGRGAMTGVLKAIDGSAPLPGLAFSLDTDTGMYRIGANTIGLAVAGALVLTIAATGITVAGSLSGSQLAITTAVGKIIPGATSISLRNNADTQDNLLIADSGAITVRSSIGGITTLTATASLLAPAVVTSIVDSGSGTLVLKGAGTTALTITGANAVFAGTIASGQITANLTGNVTGNASGTAATVTGAAQAAITSVGTLTSLTLSGLLDLGSSGQIQFPATQNPSAGVNVLDDYEEGSWTPSVGGSATYTAQEGTYTKIGRLIFIFGSLTINAIGTGDTNNITGLPFTSAANTQGVSISVTGTTALAVSVVSLGALVLGNTTTLRFLSRTAAATVESQNAIFGNGARVDFAGCYSA